MSARQTPVSPVRKGRTDPRANPPPVGWHRQEKRGRARGGRDTDTLAHPVTHHAFAPSFPVPPRPIPAPGPCPAPRRSAAPCPPHCPPRSVLPKALSAHSRPQSPAHSTVPSVPPFRTPQGPVCPFPAPGPCPPHCPLCPPVPYSLRPCLPITRALSTSLQAPAPCPPRYPSSGPCWPPRCPLCPPVSPVPPCPPGVPGADRSRRRSHVSGPEAAPRTCPGKSRRGHAPLLPHWLRVAANLHIEAGLLPPPRAGPSPFWDFWGVPEISARSSQPRLGDAQAFKPVPPLSPVEGTLRGAAFGVGCTLRFLGVSQ